VRYSDSSSILRRTLRACSSNRRLFGILVLQGATRVKPSRRNVAVKRLAAFTTQVAGPVWKMPSLSAGLCLDWLGAFPLPPHTCRTCMCSCSATVHGKKAVRCPNLAKKGWCLFVDGVTALHDSRPNRAQANSCCAKCVWLHNSPRCCMFSSFEDALGCLFVTVCEEKVSRH
jgi:hypothetical protein